MINVKSQCVGRCLLEIVETILRRVYDATKRVSFSWLLGFSPLYRRVKMNE
jgi:hypothetical protein